MPAKTPLPDSIFLLVLPLLLLLYSCSIEQSPLNYGQDICSYCKMTIVDKTHGAEMVTNKGKVFKYDAIECMILDLREKNEETVSMVLVNTIDSPATLNDARVATFLVSEGIPSPMGANLSGFTQKERAEEVLKEKGGAMFSWEKICEKIKEDAGRGSVEH